MGAQDPDVRLALPLQIIIRIVPLVPRALVDLRGPGGQKAIPGAPVRKATSAIKVRKDLLDLWEPRESEAQKVQKEIRATRATLVAPDLRAPVDRRDR